MAQNDDDTSPPQTPLCRPTHPPTNTQHNSRLHFHTPPLPLLDSCNTVYPYRNAEKFLRKALPTDMLRKRGRSDRPPPDQQEPNQPSSSHASSSTAVPLDPPPELIRFETGNPETGSTTTGALRVRSLSGSSSTLLVESVPGLMTSADFCMFVRPFADATLHFRPLRLLTERNRYVVVMHLRSLDDAANFARVFQGKLFLRGLVQEACAIREVASIEFDTGGKFPNGAMFPETTAETRPACAVCLDKLDERGAALVTTFCNHTMHAACLAKWDLNSCPVCRHTHELTPEASTCMNCNHREDLWMCVVCAYVGCGVYKKKHAHQHFAETQHPFAMNLEDTTFWSGEKLRAGSVWDYVSDRFVNRLLTSDDGKIVEVTYDERPDAAASASGSAQQQSCCGTGRGEDDVENDRGLQAAVYASRMDAVVDDYRRRLERMEAEHAAEREQLRGEIAGLKAEVGEAGKERKQMNKKVGDAEKEAGVLRDKNGFLKNLTETLLRDKTAWNDAVEKLKMQLEESEAARTGLEEQLRDLMMHLEAQAKIAGASDSCRSNASELIGGDVLRVGPSPRERLAMKTHRRVSGE
ncbi:unnamed protein product [Chondrus crispus]|uniref:BRCA1-associated protein n=1 Tax=Chondrus crispus TaxID=2769 RepID=R7QQL5_CHOCR|nr:unnamed protein product [Chondrus crispus]CDF39781.1 unnamed protein product [Chondrus crispus]|eukprot:XP_005710075.1 unnamed protein product [Chondrus crispus]